MHSTSSSSSGSVSVSSLVQYVFFAAIVYVLAGAPLSTIFGESSASKGISANSNAGANLKKLENLVVPEADLECGDHAYKGVYVLSREPLVVYIEGFLSDEEAKHVVDTRYVHPTRIVKVWRSSDQYGTQDLYSQLNTVHPSSNNQQSSIKAKKPSTHPSATLKKQLLHGTKW